MGKLLSVIMAGGGSQPCLQLLHASLQIELGTIYFYEHMQCIYMHVCTVYSGFTAVIGQADLICAASALMQLTPPSSLQHATAPVSTPPRVPEWKAEIWASRLTLCTVIARRTTTAIQHWKDFLQVCFGIWSKRFLDASSWSISRHVRQEGDLRAHVVPPIVRMGTHMPSGPGTPRHLLGSRWWTWLEKWSLGFSA